MLRVLTDDANDPFALFPEKSEEGRFLAERRDKFRKGIEEHRQLKQSNREKVRSAIAKDGALPESLGIDMSLFPMTHTQWMWGQLAAKLVRIGTNDEGGPQTAVSTKTLAPDEQRWKTTADMVLTHDALPAGLVEVEYSTVACYTSPVHSSPTTTRLMEMVAGLTIEAH